MNKIDMPVCKQLDEKNVIVGHFYLEKQIRIVDRKPQVYLKFAGKNIKLLPLSEALEQFPECFENEKSNN